MRQTDLTGRRLTISDLGRVPTRQAAAPATPKPPPPKAAATPAPSSKPAKAKAVKAKSAERVAKAAANIERDRQRHYEAITRRAAAREANFRRAARSLLRRVRP
jgi:hypothetical protein